MGRDKDFQFEDRDFYEVGTDKAEDIKKMLDRYDVDGIRSVKPDNRGYEPPGREHREVDDVRNDLAAAMMNDYDTRRGMEAAALAGDKRARRFAEGGYKPGQVGKAWDMMKRLKEEHVGGGGMSGPKNEAGLTMALVDHERDVFNQSIDERIAAAIPEEAPAEQTAEPEDHEPSRELDFAQSLADVYKQDVVNNYLEQVEPNASKSSIDYLKNSMGSYNRDLDLGSFAADVGEGYRKDASSFAEDYKSNVKGSLNPS